MYKHTRLHSSVRRYVQTLAIGAVSAAALAPHALAQDAGNQMQLEEIVVTGTLIRGVEVAGSNPISMDAENILETGAVTTNELLAALPQVSNFFNQRPETDPRGAALAQVNRPNLRNLPGVSTISGSTTLLLLDGHRLAPVGTDQATPDADAIPTIVMERVELVTDGGSSLYGADAVGGVINFTTIDKFDGVKVDLGYDAGDDYNGWQGSLLAGTDWDSGSGYIALATTDRDSVLIEDRDWAAQGDWNEDGTVLTPSGTECLEPVGAVTTWFWFAPASIWTDNPAAPGAGVTPVGEPCDIDGKSSLLPEQQRDNIFGGLTQQLGDSMTFDLKAYYMDRETTYDRYPTGDTIGEPSPNEQGLVGGATGDLTSTSQVGFSYGAHPAYRNRQLKLDIETWGITPELTIDLPNSWQIRNTLFYGESKNEVVDPQSNRAKLIEYVNGGQLDPLNVGTADAAVVNDILNWQLYDYVEQELLDLRVIADGDVFELPAGMLKAAIGAEYARDEASKKNGETTYGGTGSLDTRSDHRDVYSAFVELSIPVFESLELSVSARYDDYSDFGNTTNPQFGFSYNPTDWLHIYGKYAESFNAPTVIDSISPGIGRFVPNAAAGVPDPLGVRTDPNRDDVLIFEGSSGALGPQTAESMGFGFELRPLDELSINLYYYEIEFVDLLAAVNPQLSSVVLLNPDKFIFEPTQEEWDSLLAQIDNAEQFSDIDPADVGVVVDRRVDNTDEAELKGYDFSARYTHDTSGGTFSYGVAGNYQDEFILTKAGADIDQLTYLPDLTVSADVGWSQDNAQARVTFRYTGSSDADPAIAVNQDDVDSFLTTNLFIGYTFEGEGFVDGLSVRFNLDNVFDEEPSEYRTQRNLSYSENTWSLGRMFKFGISKTF